MLQPRVIVADIVLLGDMDCCLLHGAQLTGEITVEVCLT